MQQKQHKDCQSAYLLEDKSFRNSNDNQGEQFHEDIDETGSANQDTRFATSGKKKPIKEQSFYDCLRKKIPSKYWLLIIILLAVFGFIFLVYFIAFCLQYQIMYLPSKDITRYPAYYFMDYNEFSIDSGGNKLHAFWIPCFVSDETVEGQIEQYDKSREANLKKKISERIQLKNPPENRKKCDKYRSMKTIVYCHGINLNMTYRLRTIERMIKKLQCNVLIFSYRGYGKSEGSPTEKGIKKDAEVYSSLLTIISIILLLECN